MNFFGDEYIVLPQRYELSPSIHQVEKLYIDGPLESSPIHTIYNYPGPVRLLQYGPLSFPFETPSNPHSGCFFLTRNQLISWTKQNYWLDRSSSFISPLESSATLGICRTFNILKPSFTHAAWFEIQHHANSFHSLIKSQ